MITRARPLPSEVSAGRHRSPLSITACMIRASGAVLSQRFHKRLIVDAFCFDFITGAEAQELLKQAGLRWA